MLASALSSRSFVVTAELGPPRDPDPDLVRAGARALAGSVDAVNMTDNQAATVKLSPVACSALLIDEGVDPILQITGRDRNVMALQSELLGRVGARRADGPGPERRSAEGRARTRACATAVGDLDSLGLTRLIATMNDGRLAADEPLEPSDLVPHRRRGQPTGGLGRAARGQARGRRRPAADEHRLRRRALRRLAGAVRRGRHHRARAAARRHRAAAQQPDADLHARAHPGRRGRRRDLRPHGGPQRRRRHRHGHRDRRRADPARARGAGRRAACT